MKPYAVIDDGETPFQETAATPPAAAAAPTAPAIVEEEDEWAIDKKPYAFTEPTPEVVPACAQETQSDADKPLRVSKYYDDRAKNEAEENRRREEEKRTMPTRSKKTPTFRAALLGGVWLFMFYPSTLMAWATLAVFTTVEFLLMYMMLMVAPAKRSFERVHLQDFRHATGGGHCSDAYRYFPPSKLAEWQADPPGWSNGKTDAPHPRSSWPAVHGKSFKSN